MLPVEGATRTIWVRPGGMRFCKIAVLSGPHSILSAGLSPSSWLRWLLRLSLELSSPQGTTAGGRTAEAHSDLILQAMCSEPSHREKARLSIMTGIEGTQAPTGRGP